MWPYGYFSEKLQENEKKKFPESGGALAINGFPLGGCPLGGSNPIAQFFWEFYPHETQKIILHEMKLMSHQSDSSLLFCRGETFSKTPLGVRPGRANHNDFSVVNHPRERTKAIVQKPPPLWQTHPYICDGLSVL